MINDSNGKYDYQIARPITNKEYKQTCWDMATGLQAVDGLKPSKYLYELAEQHIAGALTNEEIDELLYKKHAGESPEEQSNREKEADLVSNRIVKLLTEQAFTFSPATIKYIHRTLFEGIYNHAGVFRTCNISKGEPILNGKSVLYANYQMISDTYAYDFEEEKKRTYVKMNPPQIIKKISEFTSSLWQVHPFLEGNTRTTAVFMECYLSSIGFHTDNTLFKDHVQYFRNALVRSNYADYGYGVDTDFTFLEIFYENLLFGGKHELRNRDMIVSAYFEKNES